MPQLIDTSNCCGCNACVNICNHAAISMKSDNEGFLQPVIDPAHCIECGSCERVCPGLSPAKNPNTHLKVFITQNKDEKVRYESTSGGAFSAIAAEIIKRHGIVFGATIDEDFNVKHTYVDSIDDLRKFRNSKYVQSIIGDTYKLARMFLLKGIYVCFSGTPCQINGLYKFLGRDYDNLITVDVVCKSIPSPLIFKKYIQFKKEKEKKISDIVFRDKFRGFHYCTMAHYSSHINRGQKKAEYRRGSESDEWLRLFLSGIMCRRSCISCPYQTKTRVGDFTLGDMWVTGDSTFDDNKGTTLLHIWTPKAKIFFNSLNDSVRSKLIPIEKSRGAERKDILKKHKRREQFFKDAVILNNNSFFDKYAPYDIKFKLKNYTRYILWKIGLQSFIRNIKHKIIHRNLKY